MMQPITYETYVRKSQEADDRQVLSIPAQIKECAAKFSDLKVARVTDESFSAKEPGRPEFTAMLDRVERGESQGIIAWHPDRLSRNSVDAGRIIYLLDKGKLKDLKFVSYTFENTPEGKWMLSMILGQAKYQVDKLTVDVNRGNREKYEKGGISWRAPQGYINNIVENRIDPDPDRFQLVRRMWDLLLSGVYTVPQIHRIATKDWGYRTIKRRKSGGTPFVVTTLYTLFRNPLYCGLNMRPDGSVYTCTHQPVISEAEFWRAQQILGWKGRPKPRTGPPSPFTDRVIRCGECGCAITVDAKNKRLSTGDIARYEYYRCTKKRGVCSQRYLDRSGLTEQLAVQIKRLAIPENLWDWLCIYFSEKAAVEQTQSTEIGATRERSVEAIGKELANLTIMRRKEHIDEDEFLQQRTELLTERALIVESGRRKSQEPLWLEPAMALIDFGYRCMYWFVRGDDADKKEILGAIGGSNLSLLDRLLHFEPVAHFSLLVFDGKSEDWCTFGDNIREYFLVEEHRVSIPKLKPVPINEVETEA